MAIQIDRGQTALLVMDCENDLVHPEGRIASAMGFAAMIQERGTLKQIRKVLDAARDADEVPIIYIEIDRERADPEALPTRGQFFANIAAAASGGALEKGSWGAEIHEDVAPLPGELRIGKFPISAFSNSTLEETLREKGVRDLILCGVATNMVVESTARAAVDLGFNVIVIEDACASFSAEAHDSSLSMLRLFGDIVTAEEIVAALR